MNWEKISQKIIEYSFYSLFFLTPLVMTPWNYELFEYNKMMLVYFSTAVIVGAWLTRMILVKKVLLYRTPFDIPIILFLISQILSTVFSMDVHTSIWGYYSRFHGGLLSTISYILLYYALVSNVEKKQVITLLKWLLVSGVFVSIYGILEHFGIDAKYWVQDVQNRVFSTLGQPNWLAAWLAIILPLPLAFILQNKLKDKPIIITYSLILITYILSLVFTKSRSGIPSAFIGLAVFGFLFALPRVLSLKKQLLLPLVGLFLVIIFGVGFWGAKSLFRNSLNDFSYIFGFSNQADIPIHLIQDPGSSSGDIRKVVWRGAVKIFQASPILGSGVETFAFSYYNFRPMEHNYLSEWDFLYNKAHNEYLNFLATTGAFGLGTYLLFIGWVIIWNIKQVLSSREYLISKEKEPSLINTYYLLLIAIFSGWLTILITNFFGFSVVPVAICFFLFPAISFLFLQPDPEAVDQTQGKIKPITSSQKFCITSLFLITSYLLLTLIRFWYADKLYADGLKLDKQGYFAVAFEALKKAVSINGGEPLYHDELGWCETNLAAIAMTNKQEKLAVDLATNAIAQSDTALKTSPRHLNFLKTRIKIYLKLAQIDPAYYQDALTYLQKAIVQAPTDPKLSYNLGLVYYQLGQKQEALDALTKTNAMKPYYNEATVALEALQKEIHGKITP